ncbi:MAG: hypothetical protein P8N76_16855 [Pirellulaceae bacterium]|nr:hypothetical protein [Pirellulaceae bacterium]
MPLNTIPFDYKSIAIPPEITQFLNSVDDLVESHRVNTAKRFRGFVPSDYPDLYQCLKAIHASDLTCGNRFCEWGSGISVVTSLAAMIGFESYGIEYDTTLCDVAAQIHQGLQVPVNIVNGSFIPEGVDDLIDKAFSEQEGELALHTEPDSAYDEIGYEIEDFDLIFAYPWPNDVALIHNLFERRAAQGALLLIYYETDLIDLHRKA